MFFERYQGQKDLEFIFNVVLQQDNQEYLSTWLTKQEVEAVVDKINHIELSIIHSNKKNQPKSYFIEKYIKASNDIL